VQPSAQASGHLRDKVWQFVTKNYTFRTILQAIITIWAIMTFTFFLVRLMPGNPVSIYIEQLISLQGYSYQEARDIAISMFSFDPDAPILQQYVKYIGNVLQGDLGTSIRSTGTPVLDIIAEFLPWTLFSVSISLIASFTIGALLGMTMAYVRDTPFDYFFTALGSLFSSVPNYLIGMIIIVVFGVQLEWFQPADLRGAYDPDLTPGFYPAFLFSMFQHALLPMITYLLSTVGAWMLSMKSSTVSTLGEDYVTVARARGIPDRRIVTSYVGRNAMLPLFTQLAINIGFVMGGSVLIERIFQYKGIGMRLLQAISGRDYPVMQGIFLVITASVVISNIVAELLYSRLDPRVRIGGQD
jgi:peptide/nickel transport system permease protein